MENFAVSGVDGDVSDLVAGSGGGEEHEVAFFQVDLDT